MLREWTLPPDLAVVGSTPERVTTDGHASCPRAVLETLGSHVQHRTNKYLNNRLEQDHRGIKQRYYPCMGSESSTQQLVYARAFEELRSYLHSRFMMEDPATLSERRRAFLDRLTALKEVIQAASEPRDSSGSVFVAPLMNVCVLSSDTTIAKLIGICNNRRWNFWIIFADF